ncbi:MAG: very short patch repair endonuclease [Opitutaceae bacterium]|nr:very short patch repair endonuclease [Opitutaceae bacterium]
MRKVRSRGNASTELRLVAIFRQNQITGWRRNFPVAGKPDFVFPIIKLALVDGCFWHGCPRHGRVPKANSVFWRAKFSRNRARDRKINRVLRAQGWHVIRVWEHALSKDQRPRLLGRFRRFFAVADDQIKGRTVSGAA